MDDEELEYLQKSVENAQEDIREMIPMVLGLSEKMDLMEKFKGAVLEKFPELRWHLKEL